MRLLFLFSWLRRRTASARPEAQVVVYSREGCHLCDEAWQLLEQFQKRYPMFDITLSTSRVAFS